MNKVLSIENLHVAIDGKEILRGVDLTIRQGEVHALMGPNGSGKSTLSYALMGHPNYEVTEGSVTLDGLDLLALEPTSGPRPGCSWPFSIPTAIPGVSVANFLRHAVTNVRNPDRKEGEDLIPMRDFRKELREQMDELGVDQEFARRYLNEGFSGGEKKRAEILQLAMLRPAFAILDETDSGLDIDAVRIVSEGVNRVAARHGTGVLVITHYERILTYIKPQFVHILFGGRIVEDGGPELVKHPREPGLRLGPREIPRGRPGRRRLDDRNSKSRTSQAPLDMAESCDKSHEGRINPMSTDLNLQVAGIKDDYKYGFHDSEENYSFKSGKGLDPRDRLPDLGDEERAAVDARLPPQGARGLLPEADADLGRRSRAPQLRRHPLLHEGGRPPGQDLGRRPGRDQEHVRQAGHPRGRDASSWPASEPSTSPRSSTTACAKTCRRRA